MPVRIRLARFGRKNLPFYRIFVADSRSPRDGKHIEVVGHYDPVPAKDGTKHVGLKIDRIRHWLSQGAQPSKPVASLLHRAGIAPAPPRSAPRAAGVRNPDKRPAKTAASFAAAGIQVPSSSAAGAAGSA